MASLRPLNVQHPNLLNIIKQINNTRKSTITNAINALESSFKTAHIHATYYPTNTHSWLLLLVNIVIQLQNEPNVRYYIKLCMEDYLYLLECCNICLNGTESTVLEFRVDGIGKGGTGGSLNTSLPFCPASSSRTGSLFACDSKRKRHIGLDFNANGISNTDVALQLYLINRLSKYSYRNLDPELYNLLVNYMNTMLADSKVIQNVIAIYTNIRKLEFLTNTMYIDQFRTLYICVSKIRAEYIRNRSHKEHLTLDVSPASKTERHTGIGRGLQAIPLYDKSAPHGTIDTGFLARCPGTGVLPEQKAGVGMTDNNINGDRIIELSSRTLLANMPGIDVDASRVDFPGINMDTFYKLFRLKHALTDVSRDVNIPDEPDMLDDETNIDALNNKDYVLDEDDLN